MLGFMTGERKIFGGGHAVVAIFLGFGAIFEFSPKQTVGQDVAHAWAVTTVEALVQKRQAFAGGGF
jgi:hypothetical protein